MFKQWAVQEALEVDTKARKGDIVVPVCTYGHLNVVERINQKIVNKPIWDPPEASN